MSNGLKLALYLVLLVLAGISGQFALTQFKSVMDSRGASISTDLENVHIPGAKNPKPEPAAPAPVEIVATNASTNLAAASTNVVTNAIATATNLVAGTNNTHTTPPSPTAASTAPPKERRLGLWFGLFILSVVGLGLMLALDVAHYFGNRTLQVLYNDEGKGVANPDYEAAEQVWSNGQFLEAIGLMRDYLKRNPREQYVALRIAEIYEKDLGNFLAAALEYEEVLKHKLAPDRWGWGAIHLCNLYFKLNEAEKGFALLRRIVQEYPETQAADKARKRLEQVDAQMAASRPAPDAETPPLAAAPPPPAASGNLPSGFRPKK